MNADTMDHTMRIPDELWLLILEYSVGKGLKSTRLISKRFENLASPLLFTTAYVAARRGVLDVFKKLTTHPVLCNYVKTMVVDGSWCDWEKLQPAEKIAISEGKELTTRATMFVEQELIMQSELQQALTTAIKSLTGLKTVVFADLSRLVGFPGEGLGTLNSRELLDYRGMSSSHHNRFSHCCFQQPSLAYCPEHRQNLWRQFGVLIALLQSLSVSAPTSVIDLKLGDPQHAHKEYGIPTRYEFDGGIPQFLFAHPAVCLPSGLRPLLHSLHRLDLTICFPNNSQSPDDYPERPIIRPSSRSPYENALGDFLHSTDNLEELKLAGAVYVEHLNVGMTLGTKRWTKLRDVTLRSCDADLREMRAFLTSNGQSLRYLLLDNFNLLSGTWTELLAYIAETLPELELFVGYVWQKGRPCWYSPRKSRLPRSEEERLKYPSDDDDDLSNDEEFDGPDGWPDEAEALSTADQEYVDEEDSTSEELEYDSGSDADSVDSEA